MTTIGTYSFAVAGIARTFEVNYSNDVRTAIAALSTTGVTDPTLLSAASAALSLFTSASAVITQIDAAVQSAVRGSAAGLMAEIYGSSPVYNSFEVNGAGILLNENLDDPKGRPMKIMSAFSAAVDALWRDAISPYLASSRNVTSTLPGRVTAFTAAIAAASPSDSKTAAQALLDAMTPIYDAVMGTGVSDPFCVLTRDRVTPFYISVLPVVQVS